MLTLLTPTGGRPEALRLLAGHINAQTYRNRLTWLICDDCDPATQVPQMRDGIEVQVIRPPWRWAPGQNTQAACMLALLDRVPANASVVIAEDDDCYLPGHLRTVVDWLKVVELTGEVTARYYNVSTRRYQVIPGTYHASLAATALCGSALDRLRAVCADGSTRIDMDLWRTFGGRNRLLNTANVVGIKGLPGRSGIGVGHRADFGQPDPDGAVLRQWLGSQAAAYLA